MTRRPPHRPLRELAARHDHGIEVRLIWRPTDNAVFVAVTDARACQQFAIHVDPIWALDAYTHPYTYVGRPDVETIEVAA